MNYKVKCNHCDKFVAPYEINADFDKECICDKCLWKKG